MSLTGSVEVAGAIMTFDFIIKLYYIIYTKDYGTMSNKRNGNKFSVCY